LSEQADLYFAGVYYYSFPLRAVLCQPNTTKFCTVMENLLDFIIPVQNFWGLPQKNFRGQKHAELGLILDGFKFWRQISLERMKIFKIRQVC